MLNKRNYFYLLSVLVLVATSVAVKAQGVSGSDHKADRNIRINSGVNPITQALEISLPLMTYRGRNGSSVPVIFNYSSKLWTMRHTDFKRTDLQGGDGTWNNPYRFTQITSFTPQFGERTISGWSSSLSLTHVVPEPERFIALDSFNLTESPGDECEVWDAYWDYSDPSCPLGSYVIVWNCVPLNDFSPGPGFHTTSTCYGGNNFPGPEPLPLPSPEPPQPDYHVKRLRVALPDGSTHEFRQSEEVFDCNLVSCAPDATEYLSVNGSGLRLLSGAINNEPGYTLIFPNGSKHSFNAIAYHGGMPSGNQKITDKNGNYSEYDDLTSIWEDNLGRELVNPLPNNPTHIIQGTTAFSLPGEGSGTLDYSQKWNKLKPDGCVTGYESECDDSALESPTDELYYMGTDTCIDREVDDPVSPFLFQNEATHDVHSTAPHNINIHIKTTIKERICGGERFNPFLLTELTYPDGSKYRFRYNRYGEMTKIIHPSGAYERYVYAKVTPLTSLPAPLDQTNRGVVQRWVSEDGVNEIQHWQYMPGKVIAPDGSMTETSYFAGMSLFGFEEPKTGRTKESKVWSKPLDPMDEESRALLSRTLNDWIVAPPRDGGHELGTRDARIAKSVSIVFENGKALATLSETEYDEEGDEDPEFFSHLNVKRQKSYHLKVVDYSTAKTADIETIAALFTSSDLAAVSETDYMYSPDYKARGILGLPVESRNLNPTNLSDVLAKTQFVYDETAYFDNNYTTTNWEDPQSNLRGNVTTTRTWAKDTDTWLETHTMYDNFGNVRKVWDASGDPTRFIENEYSAAYKYAYSTKTKAPAPDPTGVNGISEGSEITRTFDFNTGLLLSATDANGQTATNEYDLMLRPIRINPPSGGSISEVIYNDTPGSVWVKSRQQIDENDWAESTTYYDNLGRVTKTKTKDLQGDVVSEVRYDSFGRVEKTSSPYRIDSNGNPTETIYWSKVRYDERNRIVETFAPAPENQTGISLGIAEFGISDLTGFVGTYAVAYDASGRKSRAITGSYGLLRVDEATGIGGTADQDLGTLANPHQPSFYNYNIKGELTKVTQGSQNRYFMYDSFGRLIRLREPEKTPNTNLATTGNPENNQWTAGYTYDVHGNVVSVTDAKDITITNLYDKAGRTIKRTYSDSTPEVEYFYDGKGLPQVPQFSRGALTKVTSSVSEDRFTSFDNHGRLLESQQITDGQTYTFGYAYNLSGGLTEQTYPSGRIVRNFLDADGGLSLVNTKVVGGNLKTVASNFDYTATGGIRRMKLGNGLWETSEVNELQQLTQIGLGTTQTNKNLFKIDYEYGELGQDGTTVDTAKNIGMIAKATTTIPTTSFVQTFKYDAINRLTEAKEKTGSTTNWVQTFGYDRYGNRTDFSQTIGTTQLPLTTINHPEIDPANNRFTTGQGYVYDFNGNIIQDAEGRNFTFNGDDKQVEIRNANNEVIGQYFYDGSGARVKKVVPATGETTVFVYDAGGALAAEYEIVDPNLPKPPAPATSYLTTDHLGSPRVVTDENGEVVSRRDFMPFGEEIYVGVGDRTTNLKYSLSTVDHIRQRFTGYEKDNESDLDFAQARMYQNKHGRFTAPDPLMASANPANPQTFNRYIYTGNNPVNYIDPSGLSYCSTGNKTIYWTGEGNPCYGDDKVLDGGQVTIDNGGYVNGHYLPSGAVVTFNSDGTVRFDRLPSSSPVAESQGQANAQTTNAAAGSTATDVAADGIAALPTASGSSGELSLCPSSTLCSGDLGATHKQTFQRLDRSKSPGSKVAEGIGRLFEACSMVPGIGTPCAIGAGITRFGQGRFGDAGDNLFGVIPGISLLRNTARGAGLSFNAYKAMRGGTETLRVIETTNAVGKVVSQRISTEFAHVFITQRMQRRYNLPNWLVNNRVNVWKLNTVQHALIDKYRFRFLRKGIKSQVCWTCEYNWFTKF